MRSSQGFNQSGVTDRHCNPMIGPHVHMGPIKKEKCLKYICWYTWTLTPEYWKCSYLRPLRTPIHSNHINRTIKSVTGQRLPFFSTHASNSSIFMVSTPISSMKLIMVIKKIWHLIDYGEHIFEVDVESYLLAAFILFRTVFTVSEVLMHGNYYW